jgi:uncharacterized protein
MLNGAFVIDTVLHAFNLDESNYARPHAAQIVDGIVGVAALVPEEYRIPPDQMKRDWDMADTMAMTFSESTTDVGVYHPTPIFAFKDGLNAWEKAIDALDRWPTRLIASYASVDPLSSDAVEQLDRQIDAFKPLGLKLYPTSWRGENAEGWRMDDPNVAFPLYEAAGERGITTVAIHKSMPLGPVPTGEYFAPGDLEGAAAAFPDINFEIVHGGVAFSEETAWLLGRFSNIWINLEFLPMLLPLRPELFARAVLSMMNIAGEAALDRIIYSSGAMQYPPRLQLEAFDKFQFPDEMRHEYNLFGAVPGPMTDEQKAKILGLNYAALHNLDIAQLKERIKGDEFEADQAGELPRPWSKTSLAPYAAYAAEVEQPSTAASA